MIYHDDIEKFQIFPSLVWDTAPDLLGEVP